MKHVFYSLLTLLTIGGALKAGDIHDAVNDLNVARVTSLVKANPKVTLSPDGAGNTPLELLSSRTRMSLKLDSDIQRSVSLEIAQLLIANGADINARPNRLAPLLGALSALNFELAKLLIDKGANVNALVPNGADSGATPLHYAALWIPNPDMVTMLISHRANVKARDARGFTPLHIAAASNYTDIAKRLLDAGADVNATANDGRTPLAVTTFNAMKEILQQKGAK